jgi:hypothetical protein
VILETIIFVLGITSVVSTETTGKGIADHTISAVKGQDCKIVRGVRGDNVCQPRSIVTVESANNRPPQLEIPPVVPHPKKVVVANGSIDEMESIFVQRRAR